MVIYVLAVEMRIGQNIQEPVSLFYGNDPGSNTKGWVN